MNHDTVEYVSSVFGPSLRGKLDSALRNSPAHSTVPVLVSDILKRSLEQIDQSLTSEFLSLFPDNPEELKRLDPA